MEVNGIHDFDFFANLPREITIEIISRLPIRSIITSKLVCRAFRDAIESAEFHLSKPDPHLVVFPHTTSSSKSWHGEVLKLKDERIAPNMVAINLGLPNHIPLLHNSVKGLILLSQHQHDFRGHHLSICNPITREYVRLPDPPPPEYHCSPNNSFGLGVSRSSHQYKVVRIVQLKNQGHKCQIYTLGTGQWRSVIMETPPAISNSVCAFAGGNLHWLVPSSEKEGAEVEVSCFDLEREVFTTLSAPPPPRHGRFTHRSLSVLDGYLCLCDDSWSASNGEIDIWLMRDGKSWTRQFFIYKSCYYRRRFGYLIPFKVLENGDVLVWDRCSALIFYYSNKTKNIQDYSSFFDPSLDYRRNAVLYLPSFLPLKALLVEEDVRSF